MNYEQTTIYNDQRTATEIETERREFQRREIMRTTDLTEDLPLFTVEPPQEQPAEQTKLF